MLDSSMNKVEASMATDTPTYTHTHTLCTKPTVCSPQKKYLCAKLHPYTHVTHIHMLDEIQCRISFLVLKYPENTIGVHFAHSHYHICLERVVSFKVFPLALPWNGHSFISSSMIMTIQPVWFSKGWGDSPCLQYHWRWWANTIRYYSFWCGACCCTWSMNLSAGWVAHMVIILHIPLTSRFSN